MDEALIRKIYDYLRTMPSLPPTMAKVLEVCNDPRSSPAELNRVISLDPVLVGKVLKLINSAYYSPEHRITHLVRAIIMLGLNTVKNLALSSAVMNNLAATGALSLNMEGFWRHSLCVGVASKLLAEKRGIDPKNHEEYFTAGLLHDIGKIPMTQVLYDEYLQVINTADIEHLPLYLAERQRLGFNHCWVGDVIVQAWKLEGAVGDTILDHHTCAEYQGPHQDILYSVVAANHFAAVSEIGFSGDRHPEKCEDVIWESLGVGQEVFDELSPRVNEEIEKAQVFLRI
jgi:putative nucleotidyltransferase with HDIG domain